MTTRKLFLGAALVAALIGAANAYSAPNAGFARGVDVGEAAAFPENAQITVTVSLNLRNRDQLEQLIESMYTRGAPQYHQFLTTQEFRDRFGPDPAAIAAVTQHFQAAGLTVTRTATAQMNITGSATAIERAFGVQLHSFAVAATPTAAAYNYRAALGPVHIPTSITAHVRGVFGLDTRARYRSAARQTKNFPTGFGNAPDTPDLPGFWTVVDLAKYYDLEPLYQRGLDGTGRTLGIVTLASFTQSDAYTYWAAVGLNVAQDRITEVRVDGGSGRPSDQAQSYETTLDVEQSGGLAPAAKILVYEGPDTSQGFVDALAKAVDDNLADTISASWGTWEVLDGPQGELIPGNTPTVKDPVTRTKTTLLQAFDDILAQAVLQGQTVFAAAGDDGAYDEFTSLGPGFEFTTVLSVDVPADERYLTAAGGTTLAGKQMYINNIQVNVGAESAWGEDYLESLCADLNQSPVVCGIYPLGGGGGVSLYVDRPSYQVGVPGMVNTAAGQAVYDLSVTPPSFVMNLAANFPGRNVPDVSMNADPNTGYVLAYTSDTGVFGLPPGFSFSTYWGGTSFVAPQLNAIASLMVQGLGHRIGLFNVPLYQMANDPQGYAGTNAPLRAITQGDNWYYVAHPGYNPASGVGVPDVANLFDWLVSHP